MQILPFPEYIETLRKEGRNSTALPKGIRFRKNIPFGNTPERPLLLDILDRELPGTEPRPVIIFIHGGAWKQADKSHFTHQAALFAHHHDFFAVSIDYRYSQESPYPSQIQDVKCAIRWIRAVAKKENIDPERIAISGGSAGGHLSALAATTDHLPQLEGNGGNSGYSSKVHLLMPLNGVFNFTRPTEQANERARPAIRQLMSGEYSQFPEEYRQASPFFHVTAQIPPTLLLHGEADQTISVGQSQDLHQKILSCGGKSTLITFPGKDHGWFHHPGDFLEVYGHLEKFAVRHFLPPSTAKD